MNSKRFGSSPISNSSSQKYTSPIWSSDSLILIFLIEKFLPNSCEIQIDFKSLAKLKTAAAFFEIKFNFEFKRLYFLAGLAQLFRARY